MTIKSKRFTKGVITKPTTSAATEEGEIRNDSADSKQKIFTEGSEREIVTNDQTQTLSNKTLSSADNSVTIDADTATVSNLEVDNLKSGVLTTDISVAGTDTELPSAAAVRTHVASAIAGKDDASEISFDDTNPNVAGTDVQAALDNVANSAAAAQGSGDSAQSDIDDHIADATDAHAASAITNTPSGNLAATDAQGALNELQTDIDTRATSGQLDAHITDATDAHAASAIEYVNTTSGLAATQVQGAIDEVEGRLDTTETVASDAASGLSDHLSDAVDAHDASAISNVPSGNLVATDMQEAVNELQTDIDTRATNADLTSHTGDTSGVHGVTGDVVGTTDSQTLTSKTIQGASLETPIRSDVKQDTKVNLEVYAIGASNGQIVFATDEKQMYQVVDAELISIGGSGVGGVDIFHVERFEQTEAVDATTGSDAAFLGGGVASASPVNEEVSPLKGDRSIKYTQVAGSSMDYFAFPAFAVDIKERGQLAGVNISSTYTGNNNEVDLIVYDVTNSAVIASAPLRANATVKPTELVFNIPETCTEMRYGIQVITENIGAVLTIDDVEFKVNPLAPTDVYASSEWESYTPVFQGIGTPSLVAIEWMRSGSNMKIRGTFTTGTPTGSLFQLGLPNGLTVGGETALVVPTGRLLRASNSNTYLHFLATKGDSFIELGRSDRTVSTVQTSPVTGGTVFGTGEAQTFWLEVPIAGWSDSAQGVVVMGRTDSSSVENDFAFWVTNNGTAVISEESIVGTFGVSRSATGSTSIAYPGLSLTKIPSVRCTSDDFGNVNAEIKNVTTTGFDVRTYIASSDVDVDGNYHCAITKMAPDYIKETERTMVFPNGLDQPTCYISEHKSANVSSNVGPAYAVTNVFTPRRFNTTNGSCFFLSLTNGTIGVNGVANNITLKRGSYNFDCTLPSYVPNKLKSRIRSAGSSLVIGTSAFSQDAANGIDTFIKGNVAADTDDYVVTIEQWQSDVASGGGNAYGVSVNVLGEVEVYSQCSITKVR